VDPQHFDLPPPKNWQDFEELCHALWELEWDCPSIQRHGRSGQNQRGVDIFGLPKNGAKIHGIQCKLKSSSVGSIVLTSAELEREVTEAKTFDPPLEHLIVATTAPADTKIQAAARAISDRNAAQGLFRVDVLAWPEILARLFKHEALLNRYYPRLGNKLPQLGEHDVKAIRNFLPGRLVGRTAAFLSLVLGILLSVAAIKFVLDPLNLGIPTWAYGVLIVLCLVATVAQVVQEALAERTRRAMQMLAVKSGAKQTGYFRIGPYLDTIEDRTTFKRPDHAERRVLEWIEKSHQIPLFLCGDSGSGKSSLLNAYVLPRIKEQGWTVIETRPWQHPGRALLDALTNSRDTVSEHLENQKLREVIQKAVKRASDRLLIVLDQFEEFVILGKPGQQQEFAEFVADLKSRPVKGLAVLLVMRSEYQVPLEEIGLPLLRGGENLFQVGRFMFPAASAFIEESGLGLRADAIDRILTSAAELDETPGMVRPITLNVIGYVLASGKPVAPSLDAGVLIRRYIERTIEQPGIRDCAPQMLEQMITEQGTKRRRSETELVAEAKLRPAEVRAVLNALDEAGLARTLDEERAQWELSHDFIAHAVGRFLGRRRRQILRQITAYAAPTLLVVSLIASLPSLKELAHWFFTVRPYMRDQIQPYVLTPEVERALKPKDSFKECAENDDCPEMIVVPAGTYMRGSPDSEPGRYESEESPRREVMIARPFAVSKYDVTFADWDVCASIGGCPSLGDMGMERDRKPVINVSWTDAQRYATWLSRMTGRPYRLLTEAEWEYAARAGAATAYPWGDKIGEEKANCNACGSKWDGAQTSPVGSFEPNAFGLYDMVGNVWQWVQDCYQSGYKGAPDDGSARIDGNCNLRAVRGGSWISDARVLRSANRFWYSLDNRNNILGFRVARTLSTKSILGP
jgi:formylglycine-generating enzyme required for sulfatase activity